MTTNQGLEVMKFPVPVEYKFRSESEFVYGIESYSTIIKINKNIRLYTLYVNSLYIHVGIINIFTSIK